METVRFPARRIWRRFCFSLQMRGDMASAATVFSHFPPDAPAFFAGNFDGGVIVPGNPPEQNRIPGAVYGGEINARKIREILRKARENPRQKWGVFLESEFAPDGEISGYNRAAVFLAANIGGGAIVPARILEDGRRWGRQNIVLRFGAKKTLPPRAKNKPLFRAISDALEANAAAPEDDNIVRAFLRWGRRHGWSRPLFSDAGGAPLSYRQVYRAAWALGGAIAARHKNETAPKIGVMLPSSVGAAVVFYAAAFWNLTAVMLNPAGGRRNLQSACETAPVRVIYTAQKLLDNLPAAKTAAEELRQSGATIVCLEELRAEINFAAKLRAVLAAAFPHISAAKLPGATAAHHFPAAVLFTSGSEGRPKGAALGHGNLLANAAQTLARLPGLRNTAMLNSLPAFHSFGLLAGFILPAAGGISVLHYPTPLHYRKIPQIIGRYQLQMFFSADSFLAKYAEEAAPEEMRPLRFVFAGAEKLKESTRKTWAEKFGVRILEGYGVTETSPVISVNAPSDNRAGTTGRPLANIETRLLPADGIAEGGKLQVRGPNVMLGYIYPDAPGKIVPPPDGWHDTGDIAAFDCAGFLRITGRARRFVKIAGEMAPLDGIEEALGKCFPQAQFAAVRIADDARGEQIAALCTSAEITREKAAAALRARGAPPLWAPRKITAVAEIPKLPAGKTDYPAAQKIAEENAAAD